MEGFFLKLRDAHFPKPLDRAPMLVGPELFPAYAEWSPVETLDPEILAYTVGDDHLLDLSLVEEDCWGSLAHSAMLAEKGLLSAEERSAIAGGLRAVLADHRAGTFSISPAEEDVHTAVEGRRAKT